LLHKILRILFALGPLAAPAVASAHPAPFSYLDLRVGADLIEGTLVVHIIDVAHDLGVATPERLLDRSVAFGNLDRLTSLINQRLSLRTDAQALIIQWGDVEVLPERQGLQLQFRIHTPRPATLGIHAVMFPYDRLHQTFVNVYEDGRLRQQFVLAVDNPDRTYYTGTRQGALAVIKTFVPAGIHHILIGPDHILFLIGLLLLGGGWKALLKIVTAFTLGHSITLSLAALNLVTPPPNIIEPAIALSIVFVGADNLVRGGGRDVRALIALTFGLVHGFGFANVLREFGLPREALGWSLFSFNVGVEIGQLFIVLLVATALAFVRRWNATVGARVAYAGSIVVIAAGTYWFVQRVFFPAGI
jgi:hydrogenase/urease accessory protein HupE